jgi:hypothetical protein
MALKEKQLMGQLAANSGAGWTGVGTHLRPRRLFERGETLRKEIT